MQVNNKFLDDLAKVATGAAGVIAEAGQRLQQQFRENAPFGGTPGGISAEEIEAVRIMAAKAREAQAALEARVADLEREVARLSAVAGVKPAKASAARKGRTSKATASAKKKAARGK